MISKKLMAFLIGGMTFASAISQDFHNLDYLRKLKVNRVSNFQNKKNDAECISNYDNFMKPFSDEARNSLDGLVLSVYFQTNKTQLTSHDSVDIERYVDSVIVPHLDHAIIRSFNIKGYADFRGDSKKNYSLSVERAKSVLNYLESFFGNFHAYVSAFGGEYGVQTKDTFQLQQDRVVKIIPDGNPLEDAFNSFKGDIYLLDQSSSMGSDAAWAWKFLQEYNFPDSSEVYSFSKVGTDNTGQSPKPPRHTYNIRSEKPFGITPLYLALDTLLYYLPGGETITILTDGQDNFGGSTPAKIIKRANGKNIRLNIIGLNIEEKYKNEFMNLSDKTGGNYYFINKFQ